MELFTATVGRKPSCAASYLGDHTDVVELLHMLAALNQNKNR
jgi:trehalose 6-phosphate synthase/phosphatase